MGKVKTETPKTKTTTETRILKVELTQAEVLQAGDDLAAALDSLNQLQDEKESVVKSFKAREAQFEAEVTTKQLLVRNKYDFRPVECENILDYENLDCRVIRKDTGKIIVQRKMSEEEKQTSLPFDE